MDRDEFKATIIDEEAFPDMDDEDVELLSADLDEIEDLTEFRAYMARIGVVIEPKNPRQLTTESAGQYDTIH